MQCWRDDLFKIQQERENDLLKIQQERERSYSKSSKRERGVIQNPAREKVVCEAVKAGGTDGDMQNGVDVKKLKGTSMETMLKEVVDTMKYAGFGARFMTSAGRGL